MKLIKDRTTNIGKQINDLLKNLKSMNVRASHLLFSMNRWEKREDILNNLNNGINMIVDRYAFSGVVYSVANVFVLLIKRALLLIGLFVPIKDFHVLILYCN
jgi:thymidylate kinase